MVRRYLVVAGMVLTLGLLGCESDSTSPAGGGGGGDDGAGVEKPETDGKEIAKSDQWNYANDPARFRVQFDHSYDTLKQYTQGEAAQLPWPSDYWSYYEDSTNVRYKGAGTLSPVEKYDQAFNGWTPDPSLRPLDMSADCVQKGEGTNSYYGFDIEKSKAYYQKLGRAAKWQSENKGNGRMRDGRDNDNDGKVDECRGDDYDGIETWWGLCHAWAPAAILEPEPLKPVTYNGVEFTVSDIKALIITMYDRNSAVMLGDRCNEKDVKRDEVGRAVPLECRDTNAGSWHVVAVNMLAMQRRAFAMDRTYDYQVWNQPVLGFQIRTQQEVSEAQAMEKLGRPGKKYKEVFDSPKAAKWVYVEMDMKYITESASHVEDALTANRSRYNEYVRTDNYRYILELDANNDIVGGEWLPSLRTYPDFLWLPLQAAGGNPNISMGSIRTLLDLSRREAQPQPDPNLTIKTYEDTLAAAGIAIPDNNPAGIARALNVPDAVTVGSLKVTVDIEHTYIGDLRVTLTHGGKSVVLHGQTGGSERNLMKTFEINDFNGVSAQGDWELAVSDHANVDTGKLRKWSLTVGTTGTGSSARVVTGTSGITSPIAIPDNNTAGISSELTVNDAGTISKLEVTVDLTHTYIGDLKLTLVHGDSQVVLHSREGGSADDIKKTYTVTGFAGAPVKGVWALLVSDHAKVDTGKLNGWSIKAAVQ
jgi:subtilisin-like proprotein convertase family protein